MSKEIDRIIDKYSQEYWDDCPTEALVQNIIADYHAALPSDYAKLKGRLRSYSEQSTDINPSELPDEAADVIDALEIEVGVLKTRTHADAEGWAYQNQRAEAAEAERDQLRERVETLEDGLHQIQSWADAYPIDVFTPVTDAELKEWAALLPRGRFDALHGSWARHITSGMKDIARTALEGNDGA